MKKQFTIFLFLALFLSCFSKADAQTYKSAIGVRAGYPWAASFKTFISDKSAIELYAAARGYGFAGYRYGWISINGAYLVHFPIEGVENLQWYAGAGAGLQFWHFDNNFPDPGSNQSVSIQGYIGLDYKFEEVPINITLDWVPNIFLNGYSSGFYARYANLGVRYVLSE